MDNNSVKGNIIRLRKSQALSQIEMAERLGISRTAYRNIEKGETKLLSDNLEKISAALNVSPETLLFSDASDFDGGIIEEPATNYLRAIDKLKSSYSEENSRLSEEITRLNKEILSLTDQIRILKELIRTKDEIIRMLKRID